ncbi:MAG: lipopolysaccharide biosynthesis protein [Rikenellaceae bacterium]
MDTDIDMDMDTGQKNRRIVKNTLMLYVRTLISMLVGLYTSRIILGALGVEDFGIQNVLGGVVGMFSLISSSLSSSISRFITFELGKNDIDKLGKVISSSVLIQIIISLIIVILSETIGIWFVKNRLVIPPDRLYAAQWVYHISIITCVLSLLIVPYNAGIIAHEKMSFYAWITIIEAFSKLFIAYAIVRSPIDKLIFYSLLSLCISIFTSIVYYLFCKYRLSEYRNFRVEFNREIFNELFNFAGWNFIGTSAATLKGQGSVILINLFYGPLVNAAVAISQQVSSAVMRFTVGFTTALAPQIIKSFASNDSVYMMSLVYRGSRFSYYILFLVALPVLLNTDYILAIWLKDVPSHASSFVQLTIICCLIDTISQPLIQAMAATGKIRNYQITVGGVGLLNLPLTYLFYKMGSIPEATTIVAIFVSICCFVVRLYMLRGMINLSARDFVCKVVFNIIYVTLLSIICPIIIVYYTNNDLIQLITTTVISIIITSLVVYCIGCNNAERQFIKNVLRKIVFPRLNT